MHFSIYFGHAPCSDLYFLNKSLPSQTLSMFCVVYLCPDNHLPLPDNQLPLPGQPTTSARTTNFFNLSAMIYLSIFSYHLRRFILSLDSKSRRRNRESILYRPTCSSILTQHIQRNIVRSFFSRRLIFSLLRAQHSLALSKTPLTQLLNNTPMPC